MTGPHPPLLPVLALCNSRRPLHRTVRQGRAVSWPVVPHAAQLEQVAVQRAPLETVAPHSDAARALQRLYSGIEAKPAPCRARSSAGFRV